MGRLTLFSSESATLLSQCCSSGFIPCFFGSADLLGDGFYFCSKRLLTLQKRAMNNVQLDNVLNKVRINATTGQRPSDLRGVGTEKMEIDHSF